MSNGGLSKARLGRMHDIMAAHVASGGVPGLVTLMSRRDDVHVDAIGMKAAGGRDPMRRDTIFRIASMTKPITAVAADDPGRGSKAAARRSGRPLAAGIGQSQGIARHRWPADDTVPAQRAITLRDLLTFRLGHGAVMVYPERYPIQKAMIEAGVAPGPNFLELPAR